MRSLDSPGTGFVDGFDSFLFGFFPQERPWLWILFKAF
jgi:hypothetical protein